MSTLFFQLSWVLKCHFKRIPKTNLYVWNCILYPCGGIRRKVSIKLIYQHHMNTVIKTESFKIILHSNNTYLCNLYCIGTERDIDKKRIPLRNEFPPVTRCSIARIWSFKVRADWVFGDIFLLTLVLSIIMIVMWKRH